MTDRSDDLVTKVAQAICTEQTNWAGAEQWEGQEDYWRSLAQAAIDAMQLHLLDNLEKIGSEEFHGGEPDGE